MSSKIDYFNTHLIILCINKRDIKWDRDDSIIFIFFLQKTLTPPGCVPDQGNIKAVVCVENFVFDLIGDRLVGLV